MALGMEEEGIPGSAGKGDEDLGLPAAFLVLPPPCTDFASAQHPQRKGCSRINVLPFMEQPVSMDPLQNQANSCRMCLGSPEMGGDRDGGCVLIPGVGRSSGFWDHAALGSEQLQQKG